ncbi:MAG: TolC family protein [Spartobacteria bacterium]|nr:TolC family protein [Spartobacteria bacterium]
MKRQWNRLFIGASCCVVLAAAGCKTLNAPNTATKEWSPDANWENNTEDAAWSQLRTPVIDLTKTLSLADLLSAAIQQNPEIMNAWYEAKSIKAQSEQARSTFYPMINLNGKLAQSNSNDNEYDKTITAGAYGPTATLQWLLMDFGAREATYDGALQSLAAANYSFNMQIQTVVKNVAQAYYSYVSALSLVDAAQATVDATKKTMDSAQAKADAGLSTRLDVLQSKSDYENALYNLETAKNAVLTTKGTLAQLIGISADASFNVAVPKQLTSLNFDLTVSDITRMINAAMEQRADIAALRAQVAAADLSVKAAQSDRWPTLAAGASFEKTWMNYSESSMDDTDSQTATAYVALDWDIFDGFLKENKLRQKKEDLASAESQLKAAELNASTSVWNAWHNYQSALKKTDFSKAYLASSEEAYKMALDSYNAGLKDIVSLLDAQSRQASARSQMVESQKAVLSTRVDVIYALGTISSFFNM